MYTKFKYSKLSCLISGLVITFSGAIANKPIKKSNQPNVLLVITDDQGFGDLGYHNNPQIKTPVLDKFAKKATKFSNFYVSPVCAPTRASLLTGRYNIRTGVYDTYSGGAIMASNETTIAEELKEGGYQTALFGKWHLGDNYPCRPQDQGFDHTVWHLSGGIGQVGDVFNYYKADSSYFSPKLWKNGKEFQSQGYCSDVFTDEAIEFIKNSDDKPFFAYLSFNAPHTPLQVPKKYYDMYKDADISAEYFREKGYYTNNMNKQSIEAAKRVYAMVTNIDDNMGRIIKALKKKGVYDNTIIIFMTDNGPQQWRYTGGFRGHKSEVREGGIHVPFYAKFPKRFKFKKRIDARVAHIDILPTLKEICLNKKSVSKTDGISIVPALKGKVKNFKDRSLFFEWQRSYPELYRNMSVIKNNMKLIANTDRNSNINKFELYDLKNDPFESNNIVLSHKEIALKLKTELDDWYSDIISSPNITNPPVAHIGTDFENPVILNRNDAKGLPLIWDQDDIYVSWDATFEEGIYDFDIYFREEIKDRGNLVLRIGERNITLKNNKPNFRKLSISDVKIPKGERKIESWYYVKWKHHYTPFYVVVRRK